jgi:hypothetical protein
MNLNLPEATVGWRKAYAQATAPSDDVTAKWLKRAVWGYFLLLIFEGALRKWVLPSLATPLLIVRDPIALWLVIVAWRRGLIASNAYLTGMVAIAIISVFTAVLLGHGSLPVALFGARILLLHFPLIFIIGRIFTREDVVRLGKLTLWIAIPMVLLIAMQFYSPQSAWVNQGVGGDTEGAGFSGALGFFRPPGTFSFTSGNASFFSFVTPFVFYFWLNSKDINKLLLIAATGALLMAVPLSISRSLLFQVILSLVFVIAASTRKPENLWRMLLAIAGGLIVITALSQTSLFNTATEAFTSRFEGANEAEGGLEGVLIDRFLGGLIGAITSSTALPVFGYGIGMGTNVGSMLLTGKSVFLIAEGEWARIVGEQGPLLGLAVIFLRVSLTVKVSWACYTQLAKGDLLPWLLLSFGFLNIAQGGWAQPTSLGFCILSGGLIIASLRQPQQEQSKASI